jgi:hypothetical protein
MFASQLPAGRVCKHAVDEGTGGGAQVLPQGLRPLGFQVFEQL